MYCSDGPMTMLLNIFKDSEFLEIGNNFYEAWRLQT